jgi:RimJ/RimL family protein N-acetyltransferase
LGSNPYEHPANRQRAGSLCERHPLRVLLATMPPHAQNDEHENEGTLGLPIGYDVPFRIVQPSDAPALQRFLERCSERTIYLRFFGSLNEFTEEKAKYFAHVDGTDHFAFVAIDPDDQDEIIAVVRYDREPGEERAEYAAIVEDGWQGHGIGIDLTRRLVDVACANGVRAFYAMVMGKNKRMLELLRHLDLPEQEHETEGVKQVEVKLAPQAN